MSAARPTPATRPDSDTDDDDDDDDDGDTEVGITRFFPHDAEATEYGNMYLWPPCVADADIIFLPCDFYLFFLA